MNRIPRKAGGAMLLVLALAPGLSAGNKPSLAVFGLVSGAAALAAGLDPASAMTLATPGIVPSAPVQPPVFSCTDPILAPGADSDLAFVDQLAEAALKAYQGTGCDPEVAQKVMCIGPDTWKPTSRSLKMTAQAYISARLEGEPTKHAGDPGGNQGESETWAIELDKAVCRALAEFQRDAALERQDRHSELFNHLLRAGHLHRLLQETQKRAIGFRKAAEVRLAETRERAPRMRRDAEDTLAKVEKEMLPRLKLALAKEQAAYRAGRLPQASQARKEAGKAQDLLAEAREAAREARYAVETAQYEVDVAETYLAKCTSAVHRYSAHIEPILTAMSPGKLEFPVVQGEEAEED